MVSPCQANGAEDDLDKPMRCMPPFKNVVANLPVYSESQLQAAQIRVDPEEMTCGVMALAPYCMQVFTALFELVYICHCFRPEVTEESARCATPRTPPWWVYSYPPGHIYPRHLEPWARVPGGPGGCR